MIGVNKPDIKSTPPSRKNEKWRYSDLNLLEMPIKKTFDYTRDIEYYTQNNMFYYIVFIDGMYNKKKSKLPEGSVNIYYQSNRSLCDFGNLYSKHQVIQNMQNTDKIVCIDINKSLDKPLQLIKMIVSSCNMFTIKIILNKNCTIKLFEKFIQQTQHNFYLNNITKIDLASHSKCTHFFEKDIKYKGKSIYTLEVNSEDNSSYKNYSVNSQYSSHRFESDIYLRAKNAIANFYGVCIATDNQIFDVVIDIHHHASNTSSKQHYNQVLNKNSIGSFYSNVFIAQFLNQIEAHQLNKNLIIDNKSQAYSRPMLNINSDDVICSHGATTGNISQDILSYFASRGIQYLQAKRLIIIGLLKSVFSKCELEDYEIRFLYSQINNAI